jgi:hypothetical protein
VRSALVQDPEAAALVFFDHEWEPPLCAAVRLGCDAGIISLLIKHGADVYAADMRGRTPLTILSNSSCSLPGCTVCFNGTTKQLCEHLVIETLRHWELTNPYMQETLIEQSLAVAEAFARAGVDSSLPDDCGDHPCALATACGNNHLAKFWE